MFCVVLIFCTFFVLTVEVSGYGSDSCRDSVNSPGNSSLVGSVLRSAAMLVHAEGLVHTDTESAYFCANGIQFYYLHEFTILCTISFCFYGSSKPLPFHGQFLWWLMLFFNVVHFRKCSHIYIRKFSLWVCVSSKKPCWNCVWGKSGWRSTYSTFRYTLHIWSNVPSCIRWCSQYHVMDRKRQTWWVLNFCQNKQYDLNSQSCNIFSWLCRRGKTTNLLIQWSSL